MKSITITAKVKLYPTSEQMMILNKTLSVIRDVLNFVSASVSRKYLFETLSMIWYGTGITPYQVSPSV